MRGRKVAAAAMIAACCALAVAPLLVVTDLPAVDQPHHLATIAVWNHIDEPRYGQSDDFIVQVRPDPYFIYYASVHYLSYVMPIRAANHVFLVAAVLGCALGLRALLRAHRRPAVLALAGLPLAWNYNMGSGFISTIAATGVLLWAFALLARFEDARPWPTRRLWIANILAGVLLYHSHFLAWMVWAPIAVLRLRLRGAAIAACSAPLFLIQADKPELDEKWELHARWHENDLGDIPHLLLDYVGDGERAWLLAALAASFVLAWILVERDVVRDRRPLVLGALLLALFVALPFALFKPFYWSNINVRLAPIAAMVAFACVPAGRLAGWRAMVVAAPIAVVLAVYAMLIIPRFQVFEKDTEDFYSVMLRLPMDPDVFVDIPHDERDDPLHKQIWRQYASYVGVERGGARFAGWWRGFPIAIRPGREHLVSPKDDRRELHRFILERRSRARPIPGYQQVAARGKWFLWVRDARAAP